MSDIWKEYSWLTISEAAAYLGVEAKAIRSWLKDVSLLALPSPEDGKLRIPQVFLVAAESEGDYRGPLEVLRGTLILLRDGGFSDAEAMNWMLSEDDSLGDTPQMLCGRGARKLCAEWLGHWLSS